MASSTAEVVNSFIDVNGSALTLPNVAIDAKNEEVLASTLGALSTIETFAALAAKSHPLAALSLTLAAQAITLPEMYRAGSEWDMRGAA